MSTLNQTNKSTLNISQTWDDIDDTQFEKIQNLKDLFKYLETEKSKVNKKQYIKLAQKLLLQKSQNFMTQKTETMIQSEKDKLLQYFDDQILFNARKQCLNISLSEANQNSNKNPGKNTRSVSFDLSRPNQENDQKYLLQQHQLIKPFSPQNNNNSTLLLNSQNNNNNTNNENNTQIKIKSILENPLQSLYTPENIQLQQSNFPQFSTIPHKKGRENSIDMNDTIEQNSNNNINNNNNQLSAFNFISSKESTKLNTVKIQPKSDPIFQDIQVTQKNSNEKLKLDYKDSTHKKYHSDQPLQQQKNIENNDNQKSLDYSFEQQKNSQKQLQKQQQLQYLQNNISNTQIFSDHSGFLSNNDRPTRHSKQNSKNYNSNGQYIFSSDNDESTFIEHEQTTLNHQMSFNKLQQYDSNLTLKQQKQQDINQQQQYTSQIKELQKIIQQHEKEQIQKDIQIQQLTVDNNGLQNKIQNIEEQNQYKFNQQQNELEQVNTQIQTLNQQIKILEKQQNNNTQQQKQIQIQPEQQESQQVQQLQQQYDKILDQVFNKVLENDKQIKQYKKQIALQDKQNTQLKKEYNDIVYYIQNFKQNIQNILDNYSQQLQQFNENEQFLEKIQKENSILKQERDYLLKQMQQMQQQQSYQQQRQY